MDLNLLSLLGQIGMAHLKAYVTVHDRCTTVQQTENMSHTFFDCHQSTIVLGACAFHSRSLSVSREAFAFPLTSVMVFQAR